MARVVPNCRRSWRLALIQTFSMFCVHISVVQVYKVVLMHGDVVQVDVAIVQVDAAIQPSDMTCVPERHPYWISGNNVGPVLALTTCSMRRPLSLHCTKHPQTVHDSASLVFPTMKVGLLDLDDDRLPSVVEATDLRLLSPRVLRTDVPDEIGPVDQRPRRDTEVPRHVVRWNVSRPLEQKPHKLPQFNLALEERPVPLTILPRWYFLL